MGLDLPGSLLGLGTVGVSPLPSLFWEGLLILPLILSFWGK
jgi:hypothetical protein